MYHAGDLVEGKVVGSFGPRRSGRFRLQVGRHDPGEEFASKKIVSGRRYGRGRHQEHSLRRRSAPAFAFDAKSRKVWNDIEEAYKNDTPITGKIVDKTKGGLKVDINGIEAFLPGSQIDSRPIRGLDTYIGQDIEAKIIKFSRRRNNIVLLAQGHH